ncbi:MAG: hypothetical protein WKF45_02880 [Ilumatobacteraceae bacterium]
MPRRRILAASILVWAVAAAAISMFFFRETNDDARLIVGAMSIAGPVAAAGAAVALAGTRDRLAGVLLLASATTPTYGAWAVNVLPMIVGALLMVGPRLLTGGRDFRGTARSRGAGGKFSRPGERGFNRSTDH